jgi:hypothetical protein
MIVDQRKTAGEIQKSAVPYKIFWKFFLCYFSFLIELSGAWGSVVVKALRY